MLLGGVLTVLLFTATANSQEFSIPLHCDNKSLPGDQLLAYRGWPFQITCYSVTYIEDFNLYDWYDYDYYDDNIVKCVIINTTSSAVLFNQSTTIDALSDEEADFSFLTPDVNENSLQYTLTIEEIDGSRCVFVPINLNVTELEETTCEDFSSPRSETQYISSLGESMKFDCMLSLNEYPKINLVDELITIQWYHDCSANLPSNVQVINISGGSKLEINKLQHENAGSYICSVAYKGMTKFISKVDLCLTHSRSTNEILLACQTDEVFVNIGDNTTLSCTATFGEGNIKNNDFLIDLRKMINATQNDFRISRCGMNNSRQRNINCLVHNPHDVCYYSFDQEKNRRSPIAKVEFTFAFTNIQRTDFGRYFVFAELYNQNGTLKNVSFVVHPNPIPVLLSEATMVGISIGVLLVFLIVMFFVLWNSVYIRVYYKIFFGVYELDNKDFGATLVYNFSTCDLDKFAREKVQAVIPKIRQLLESFGYAVYDENSNGLKPLGRAESVSDFIGRSHRVVIFLSSDFIHNEWSMLALHKGFLEMINNGSKLIFILLPGIRAYLKQHAKENDSCALLLRAIKINYAIDLPQGMTDRRFQYQVRDAMPKLRPRPRSSVSSIWSNCTSPDYQNITFQRCFSNETQMSDMEMLAAGIHGQALHMIEEQEQQTYYDDAL